LNAATYEVAEMPKKKLTTEEFIERARAVHGERYDYSQVVYTGSNAKVEIVCREHGAFAQEAFAHLRGQGCRGCSRINRRLTTAQFIAKAKETHGDLYDYGQAEYTTSAGKIKIICREHGAFTQGPHQHMAGVGCPKCGFDKTSKALRMDTEEFVAKAQARHGDRYDYSKSECPMSQEPITITCREHGDFTTTPVQHLRGGGCQKCSRLSGNKKQSLGRDAFIAKANELHGDRYDYSKVAYVSSKLPVTIICREHGEFQQKPNGHLSGQGCMTCSGKKQLNTEAFIERAIAAHGDRYDYSQVEYTTQSGPVKIVCPEHGGFMQKAKSHMRGDGCPDCGGSKQLTTEQFIGKAKAVHGDSFDYSQTVYRDANTKVSVICQEHGKFLQSPGNHLSGYGCFKCANKGFQFELPGIIYYLRVEHEGRMLYKVGITNNTVKKRFKACDLDKITVLYTQRYELGTRAYQQEQQILKAHTQHKYTGPDILTSGNTELFTKDILELDVGTGKQGEVVPFPQ
jgi:Zn finger protein HypA/HybF involved in hydrogenase expression